MNRVQLRVIPVLLLHHAGVVKTRRFKNPVYIGDPINSASIFSSKMADELLVIDIDATRERRQPSFALCEDIASQAMMPTTYGGGINSVSDMERVFACGIEKASVSSSALTRPELINECAKEFGSQSVVVTIDVRRRPFGRECICSHNGRRVWPKHLEHWSREVADRGAGEIVIQSVDRDGTMKGYDVTLVRRVASAVHVPVVALGGASGIADVRAVILEAGASAAAVGSLFVFQGPRKAVLLSYPRADQLAIDEPGV